MNPTNEIERVRFARDVITQWRQRVNWYQRGIETIKENTYDRNSVAQVPLTHGFVGLLDYIRTGDLDKILCPYLHIIFEAQIYGKTIHADPKRINQNQK